MEFFLYSLFLALHVKDLLLCTSAVLQSAHAKPTVRSWSCNRHRMPHDTITMRGAGCHKHSLYSQEGGVFRHTMI